jgi:hypothetical protein
MQLKDVRIVAGVAFLQPSNVIICGGQSDLNEHKDFLFRQKLRERMGYVFQLSIIYQLPYHRPPTDYLENQCLLLSMRTKTTTRTTRTDHRPTTLLLLLLPLSVRRCAKSLLRHPQSSRATDMTMKILNRVADASLAHPALCFLVSPAVASLRRRRTSLQTPARLLIPLHFLWLYRRLFEVPLLPL